MSKWQISLHCVLKKASPEVPYTDVTFGTTNRLLSLTCWFNSEAQSYEESNWDQQQDNARKYENCQRTINTFVKL